MKGSKFIKLMATVVVGATLLVGCGSATSSKDKTYLIATDSKYAPFSYEKDGKYEGIDVEILDAIAKEEGINYELKPMDFSAIIPGLTANQLDGAIAGMSITDERKEVVDFSDGYFDSGLSIVVKGDNTAINGKDDLKGKVAAVKNGTAGEKYALDNEKALGLNIKHYEDSPTMYLAVENGDADFALEDYPVVAYKIKIDNNNSLRIAGDKVTNVQYGFAVKKGTNKELMDKFQAGLKKIKENGVYDEILAKYLK